MPAARPFAAKMPALQSATTLLDATTMLDKGDAGIDGRERGTTGYSLSAAAAARNAETRAGTQQPGQKTKKPELWLSNIAFVAALHAAALLVAWKYPLRWEAVALMFVEYQIGMFGYVALKFTEEVFRGS